MAATGVCRRLLIGRLENTSRFRGSSEKESSVRVCAVSWWVWAHLEEGELVLRQHPAPLLVAEHHAFERAQALRPVRLRHPDLLEHTHIRNRR